jgi:hypothetical protein
MAVCSPVAQTPRRQSACQRGPKPLGRAAVAAEQSAKSLINGHLVAIGSFIVIWSDQVIAGARHRASPHVF